jgi:hypothetical protein
MERRPEDVAKQLTGYADAVAAFSFVQSVAFGLALGGNDLPSKLWAAPWWLVPSIMIVTFGFYMAIVCLCQNEEKALFSCTDASKKVDGVVGRIRGWRVGVIFLAAILSGVAYGFTRHGYKAPVVQACGPCQCAQSIH